MKFLSFQFQIDSIDFQILLNMHLLSIDYLYKLLSLLNIFKRVSSTTVFHFNSEGESRICNKVVTFDLNKFLVRYLKCNNFIFSYPSSLKLDNSFSILLNSFLSFTHINMSMSTKFLVGNLLKYSNRRWPTNL